MVHNQTHTGPYAFNENLVALLDNVRDVVLLARDDLFAPPGARKDIR